MNGEWTFSDVDIEWVHDTFDTKEEAIEESKKQYDNVFLVGQLSEHHVDKYKVINVEEVVAQFDQTIEH